MENSSGEPQHLPDLTPEEYHELGITWVEDTFTFSDGSVLKNTVMEDTWELQEQSLAQTFLAQNAPEELQALHSTTSAACALFGIEYDGFTWTFPDSSVLRCEGEEWTASFKQPQNS